MRVILSLFNCIFAVGIASAYNSIAFPAARLTRISYQRQQTQLGVCKSYDTLANSKSIRNSASATAATVALSFALLFGSPMISHASDKAAQISLQSIPPSTVSIQIQDLPVVGNLISGVYTKVSDKLAPDTKPSVVIQSPKDKVAAIAAIAKGGHLEFDVTGKISTHLDIDVAADETGTLKVLVQSPLIPKLPFKNLASTAFSSPIVGGKESAWNIVTNLGTGESYYYNMKTGVTQYQRPDRL
jgi:hypothetical protein